MSATNLTDIVKSLSNSTRNNAVISPVSTWEMRLQAYWQHLFGYSIGSVLCILIIYISIFSKHITGDYKWFVLNQALANFFYAIGNISYTLVVYVWYTEKGYNTLRSGDPPLWVYIYFEATYLLMYTFGQFATINTLFATVFNRWMAIVMPDHYQKFMSARLIVLYCILCYVVTIASHSPLFYILNTSNVGSGIILTGCSLIPWLLSIILSVQTYFKLWNHMRTTTTITDKRRLQESRNVLYSLMIQIAVLFFEKLPYYFYRNALNVMALTGGKDFSKSFVSLIGVFIQIGSVLDMYTNAYTCIIILITMRPYRRAVLSLISPVTKFCQHHLEPNVTPTTTDNRVTQNPIVVNVQPARRVSSP